MKTNVGIKKNTSANLIIQALVIYVWKRFCRTIKNKNRFIINSILVILFCISCKSKPAVPPMFEVLDNNRTGLNFSNELTATDSFNMLEYMYFYNGAGVGAGDFNNDGKVDLFFSSNQGNNSLYLNTGELHFKDVTDEAEIPKENAWNTGVSIVD